MQDQLDARLRIACSDAPSPEAAEEAYAQALAYLAELTDWERQPMDQRLRERLLLARPAALLERLGSPQHRYRSVLVAGTKGKGSTAAMLASILRAAGYRTGFYSQPHLHTYRERIRVDGVAIAPTVFAEGVARLQPHVAALESEHPELGRCTAYEVGTALALDYFARSGVELAVLEVGLGGRLDATNVVEADVSIITSISFDHMAILGSTLPEIAFEKAGIIKPGRPVLSAPQRPEVLAVLERVADERGALLAVGGRDWRWAGDHAAFVVEAAQAAPCGLWAAAWRHTGLRVPLLGAHQLENAATAVAAAQRLGSASVVEARSLSIPPAAIATGLAGTRWPARLEVISPPQSPLLPEIGPTVVIDGAHNGDSAAKLAAALRAHFRFRRLWLVLGVSADKDLAAIVAPLAPLAAGAWAVASRHPRSLAASAVAAALRQAGVRTTTGGATAVGEAVGEAVAAAGQDDLVCITGSLYVAAEAREALNLPMEGRDPQIIAPA